jgi:hypothetical protein
MPRTSPADRRHVRRAHSHGPPGINQICREPSKIVSPTARLLPERPYKAYPLRCARSVASARPQCRSGTNSASAGAGPRIRARYDADLRQDGVMADRWRAPGGWTVEVVRLCGTPDKRDGEWLRVRHYGYHTADVRSIPELAQWFPLAELEPDEGGLARSDGSCRAAAARKSAFDHSVPAPFGLSLPGRVTLAVDLAVGTLRRAITHPGQRGPGADRARPRNLREALAHLRH